MNHVMALNVKGVEYSVMIALKAFVATKLTMAGRLKVV